MLFSCPNEFWSLKWSSAGKNIVGNIVLKDKQLGD